MVLTVLSYGLLAILAVGLLFGLGVWVLPKGEQIAPPLRDDRPWQLMPADRPMSPNDVVDTKLPVALRGYRFAETDLLLDRLTEELRARDATIAELRGALGYEHPAARPALGRSGVSLEKRDAFSGPAEV